MLNADAVLHTLAFVAYVAEAMTAALAAGRRTMDWVGVALLTMVLVRTESSHLVRLLNDRADNAARILFGLVTMLLMRSFVEVDVINPYVVGSFLLYYAAGVTTLSPARVTTHYAAFRALPSQ